MREITIPISDETIRSLKVGDPVALTGVMITGRDTAHKWLIDTFIKKTRQPQGDDLEIYEASNPCSKVALSITAARSSPGWIPSNISSWLPDQPLLSAKNPTRPT